MEMLEEGGAGTAEADGVRFQVLQAYCFSNSNKCFLRSMP